MGKMWQFLLYKQMNFVYNRKWQYIVVIMVGIIDEVEEVGKEGESGEEI